MNGASDYCCCVMFIVNETVYSLLIDKIRIYLLFRVVMFDALFTDIASTLRLHAGNPLLRAAFSYIVPYNNRSALMKILNTVLITRINDLRSSSKYRRR